MHPVLARMVATAAIVVVTLGLFSQGTMGQTVPKPRPSVAETTAPKIEHGRVYLLRGLANIFSLGMNTLAEELKKRGVDAVVTNHSHGFDIADKLAKTYETDKTILPIILIGHSLGANKTLTMSARLAEKNVPVRLIILFDATVALPVPRNVEEVLNLHKPDSIGVAVAGVSGYSGLIDNKDVSEIPGVGHVSIDKSRKLHAEVVEKVLAVLAEKPGAKKKK